MHSTRTAHKPRDLMGVGTPRDLVAGVMCLRIGVFPATTYLQFHLTPYQSPDLVAQPHAAPIKQIVRFNG